MISVHGVFFQNSLDRAPRHRHLVRDISLTCSGVFFKRVQHEFLVGPPTSERLEVTCSVSLPLAIACKIVL
jgi:hypothetical protein